MEFDGNIPLSSAGNNDELTQNKQVLYIEQLNMSYRNDPSR